MRASEETGDDVFIYLDNIITHTDDEIDSAAALRWNSDPTEDINKGAENPNKSAPIPNQAGG